MPAGRISRAPMLRIEWIVVYKKSGIFHVAKKTTKAGGWLFKEEPGCYNYSQLEKDGSTVWAGVKNAMARIHLRKVRPGDRVLYYHTGQERAIVGEMRIVRGPEADPQSGDP